ncbi:hypothetical protein F4680DRAFT_419108 [Xylaria scruposa]|nr:hypothetical protein F4680DRAFT_419108 [Xylaria scruposa]
MPGGCPGVWFSVFCFFVATSGVALSVPTVWNRNANIPFRLQVSGCRGDVAHPLRLEAVIMGIARCMRLRTRMEERTIELLLVVVMMATPIFGGNVSGMKLCPE